MNRELRVLMLEDTPSDAELAERELRKSGIVLRRVADDAAVGGYQRDTRLDVAPERSCFLLELGGRTGGRSM